jgi:prepilin-type N-terminal cleavage/methylation domain-containing protein
MVRLHRQDRGMSLVELMVAIMLMTIVAAVFLSLLRTTMFATRDLEGTARSNDDVRLALQQLDRDFRSSEQICEPLPGNTSNRLDFRTRAYTATTTATGYQDLIYELRDPDGDGSATDLQRSSDGGITWTTVIGGVQNETIVDDDYNAAAGRPLGTAGVPIFTNQGGVVTALPSQGKVITVRLWVDFNVNDRIAARLGTTEISGRNIWTPNSANCP